MNFIFSIDRGLFVSSFVIDLIMAIVYLLQRNKMSPHLKISISITKLLGDLFAGLYYFKGAKLVAIIAVIVFVCNVIYLLLNIIEYKTTDKKIATKKNTATVL